MSAPIRYTNGVTNVANGSTMGQFGAPDRTKYHEFWDDFEWYVLDTVTDHATDKPRTPSGFWLSTETEGGAGDTTITATDAQNGVLSITNDAADDDSTFLFRCYDGAVNELGEFKFASGKKLWYKCRIYCAEATQVDIIMGLHIDATDPIDTAPTDGVFFRKSDGSTNIDIVTTKNSNESTAVVGTLTASTWTVLGYYWDGVSKLYYYKDDVEIGSIEPSTNLPDDEAVGVSIGIQNGSANARTLLVDYVWAVAER